jgi:hypothetical protein
MVTAEAQEGCLWEEVLLSDLTDSSELDEALEDIDVVIETPVEFDHA